MKSVLSHERKSLKVYIFWNARSGTGRIWISPPRIPIAAALGIDKLGPIRKGIVEGGIKADPNFRSYNGILNVTYHARFDSRSLDLVSIFLRRCLLFGVRWRLRFWVSRFCGMAVRSSRLTCIIRRCKNGN